MRNYCYLQGTTHTTRLCFLNSLPHTHGSHNFYQGLATVFSLKVSASGIRPLPGANPGVNREGFSVAGISQLPRGRGTPPTHWKYPGGQGEPCVHTHVPRAPLPSVWGAHAAAPHAATAQQLFPWSETEPAPAAADI